MMQLNLPPRGPVKRLLISNQLKDTFHMLTKNMGTVDRALRIVVGLAILSLVFVGPQTLWGLLGLIPIATGALGSCPAYLPFGIKTCKT